MNSIRPKLVEYNIKSIINTSLNQCHGLKMKYYSFIFNLLCFILLVSIIGGTLYFKYKGHTKEELQRKENEKRDYILYNLRKFQNIKNSHITNIPQEQYDFYQ